jgi:potassium/hydrogen antiporter
LESLNHLILIGAGLIFVSILAGVYSSRLGAPLLLVFLVLGMLAGEDGPGGIMFDDFRIVYLVGSVGLALILFDGGLHTTRTVFRLALWPAVSLATAGVIATALIVGGFGMLVFGLKPLEALLLGSILSSTDAAAVFLLLQRSDRDINRRVRATLEAESGMNDPMAVFLTILTVELLLDPANAEPWQIGLRLAMQLVGGAAIGVGGGLGLRWLINRIEIAVGLYPILAAAGAVAIFSAANVVGASGFLAAYLAGIVMGRQPYRAKQVIARFHDGLIWLVQIAMFLLLGLVVTPSALLPLLLPAVLIAVLLLIVARPVAVWLALLPFRLDWRAKLFVSWVGLRGAVPIFLASIPIVAGLALGPVFFKIAFVVVIMSLLVQGWTALGMARALGLEVPSEPEQAEGATLFELPTSADREIVGYRLRGGCPVLEDGFASLALPKRTRVVGVIREGAIAELAQIERLQIGDYVILLVPPEQQLALDRLFTPVPPRRAKALDALGEFAFASETPASALASQYGLAIELDHPLETLGAYLARRLGAQAVVGDRIKLGEAELVVRALDEERIGEVGLELLAEEERLPAVRLWRRLVAWARRQRLGERLRPLFRRR